MSIIRTDVVPTEGPDHFTVHFADKNGDRVSVRVPRALIDKLEPRAGVPYRMRLENNIEAIMEMAQDAYVLGKVKDKMIYLSPDDFGTG
jgi:hypothetical protein